MKFTIEELTPVLPRRANKKVTFWWKLSAQHQRQKFTILLADCTPINGGFEIKLEGKAYKLSTSEINLKKTKLRLKQGPPELNLNKISNKRQKQLWHSVKNKILLLNLGRPTGYGGHAEKLGADARESVLGCKKEQKLGNNSILIKHLSLAKEIILSVPNRFPIVYPRIHIVEGATTPWHCDACRSNLPQYFRILRKTGSGSKHSGLLMDTRISFGKSVFKSFNNSILIPMTYRKNKFGGTDDGINLLSVSTIPGPAGLIGQVAQ